jgi:hypothetical protein
LLTTAQGLPFQARLAVGARADVDGVLQHARQRAVVLGGAEQDAVGGADAVAEFGPARRRRVGLVILVVHRQVGDVDDLQFQRGRRHQHQVLGQLAGERFLAEAAYQYCDLPLP